MPFHDKEEDNSLLAAVDGQSTEEHGIKPRSSRAASRECRHNKYLLFGLSLSVLLNILLISTVFYTSSSTEKEPPSKYAGLQRDREEPYVIVTDYGSENTTLTDELWYGINVDSAVVALSDDWAREHGLRTAQRFPWDQSKGVYILHGYHNLHCLKIIYISLSEYRRGVPQSRNWHHISHCFDGLRRQIICDADDTPRATEHRAEVVSGLLQHRQCRSWEALEEFAKQHTGCYKRPDNPNDGKPIIDRFKHCPPDSGYVIKDNYVNPDEFLVGLPEESLQIPEDYQ
ncbi:hypothetical protein GGS20DRAFT_579881 [Poronia punctata]|nr:hypothetical protein GGS20DRAFT_579881 [Poronia punctata]